VRPETGLRILPKRIFLPVLESIPNHFFLISIFLLTPHYSLGEWAEIKNRH
jgi:hypothetical protein